jgi:hypothetical protein
VSRRPLDAYQTPVWMSQALLSSVPEITGTILEACSGDNSLANVLRAQSGTLVITNDIDLTYAADLHNDARSHLLYEHAPSVDWVVTNPPFEQMLPILKLALQRARVGVAMLSRISFLEPTNTRGPWLKASPPHRYLVTERHSFTGNGKSDSATTAWLVWSKYPLSGRPIEILHGWRPRAR